MRIIKRQFYGAVTSVPLSKGNKYLERARNGDETALRSYLAIEDLLGGRRPYKRAIIAELTKRIHRKNKCHLVRNARWHTKYKLHRDSLEIIDNIEIVIRVHPVKTRETRFTISNY